MQVMNIEQDNQATAQEFIQKILSQHPMLRYFAPYRFEENQESLTVSCQSATGALMLHNVLADEIGLQCASNLEEPDADDFHVKMALPYLYKNCDALDTIAQHLEMYLRAYQKLHTQHGILRIVLKNNYLRLHCSQQTYKALAPFFESEYPSHANASSVLPIFPVHRLTPESLLQNCETILAHLPNTPSLCPTKETA